MPQGNITLVVNIAGSQFNNTIVREADGQGVNVVELPAGVLEDSYSNVDSDTCDVGLPDGHGLTNGAYTAYWSEAGVDKVAVGCAGTVISNTITLDAPLSGDSFPAVDPADMVVSKEVFINTNIDGDEVKMLAISPVNVNLTSSVDCSVDLHDVSSNQIETYRIPVNQSVTWWSDGGSANPLTGNPITHCHASNQSTTLPVQLYVLWLYDSTP